MSIHRRNPSRDKNEQIIIDELRMRGWFVTQLSGSGVPDLLCGKAGQWVLIEVKGPTGRLTASQQVFFDRAAEDNLPVFLCRTAAELQTLLPHP